MDRLKRYKQKSFGVIIFYMLFLGAAISAAGYYGLYRFLPQLASEDGQAFLIQSVPNTVVALEAVFQNYFIWVVPCISGLFLSFGILGWWVLLSFLSPSLKTGLTEPEPAPRKKSARKDFVDQKTEQDRKRRIFLHALSVLQREGRLLDFFNEDLSVYEDGQIGAAVRSIQEDCKKAVKKYIDPRPVVEGEEGDTITVEDGFDIDAINLVGNVSGRPPFQGVIRHPGWKAGKKDLPKLSDIQDPGIMTPAEIEIQ